MRKWDHYEFKIAGHFLPALFNDDWTGLDAKDDWKLSSWVACVQDSARNAGFTVGHWSHEGEESDDWGTCSVTGLFTMRQTVKLMVYKDE